MGKIKTFFVDLLGRFKNWLKNIKWSSFFGDRDIAYLYPFIIFAVQLILIPKSWLWDLVVLVLYAPILYFGYLKEYEKEE